MSTFYMLNSCKFSDASGARLLKPGTLIDDTQVSTAAITASGGRYFTSTDTAVAAAAATVQAAYVNKGLSLEEAEGIMEAAIEQADVVPGGAGISGISVTAPITKSGPATSPTIALTSPLPAANAPLKAVYATGGAQALVPSDIGAQASGAVTAVTGTAPIASSGGATPAISITAATTGAAGSMSAADKAALNDVLAVIPTQYRKSANDGAAATATAELAIGFRAGAAGQSVNRVYYVPDANLTADNTNFATLKLWKRAFDGSTQVLVASRTTAITDSGNWTAFSPMLLTLSVVAGATTLASGDTLTFEITKSGAGVVVPSGGLYVDRIVT